MSCKLNKNLLFSFSDGTIDPLEKIFVEEHIKYCLECQNELKLIDKLDYNLKSIQSDIKIPDKLSTISELILENSIKELENKDSSFKLNNSIKSLNSIRNVIIHSFKITNYDPCSRYITSRIINSSDKVKKPLKKYCKQKILKFLKAV